MNQLIVQTPWEGSSVLVRPRVTTVPAILAAHVWTLMNVRRRKLAIGTANAEMFQDRTCACVTQDSEVKQMRVRRLVVWTGAWTLMSAPKGATRAGRLRHV